MKKVLSLILAFMFIVSAIPVLAKTSLVATEETQKYEDMIKLLKLTQIVSEEFEITDSFVTRGEFAAYLVRSKGMNNYLGAYGNNYFTDVNDLTDYATEIALAKDMNLINGYTDGSFKPEDSITVLEAAICFIRVLGYNVKAEGLGGYPQGYYEVIRETGILKNINKAYSENITIKDLILLVHNALHTKIMVNSGVSSDGGVYTVSDSITLLYDSFGIYCTEGVVNGVDITNLFGDNDLPYYSVYVGKDVFYTGPYSMNEMLGYNVRAYYINEDSQNVIKLAVKTQDKNNEEIINIEDIASINKGVVTTLDDEGKEKKYKYNESAAVIYNGANTKSDFDTDIYKDGDKILTGTVKLLDNNDDNKADVIFVEAYENMIIGRIDADNGYVYDYFDPSKKFQLSTDTDEPYVLIYDNEGELTDTDSLTTGESLTIYKSKEDAWQTFVRAYVSSITVTGKISMIEKADGKTTITIEETEYILSKYAMDNGMLPVIGRTAEVLLNKFGEVARFTYSTEPGDYDFAMLCGTRIGEGFEGKFYIKMMDKAGNILNVTAANKLKLDGKNYNTVDSSGAKRVDAVLKNASMAITGEANGNYCFQIIKYGINNDGQINYIDTVLDENGVATDEDSIKTDNEIFFGIIEGDKSEYFDSTGMVAQKVVVTDDVKVFMFPQKGSETDTQYYGVRDRKYFVNSSDHDGIVYFKDKNEGFDAPVFMKQFESSEIKGDISGLTTSIVTKVTDSVNIDGELRKKWYLFSRGIASSYMVDPEMQSATTVADDIIKAKDVQAGDIIYFTLNSVTEEIEAFIVLYSAKNDKIYNVTSTYNGMEKAHALKSTPVGIKLIYESLIKNGIETDRKDNFLVFNNLKNTNGITVFDTKTNKVRQGTYNDIIGYEEDKTDYTDDLIVRWYQPTNQVIREIFVFKR